MLKDAVNINLLIVSRFMGYKRTILLNRKAIVAHLDEFKNHTIDMDEFSVAIRQAHEGRTGTPFKRRVIPGFPKEEDYFYANPEECLCTADSSSRSRLPYHQPRRLSRHS